MYSTIFRNFLKFWPVFAISTAVATTTPSAFYSKLNRELQWLKSKMDSSQTVQNKSGGSQEFSDQVSLGQSGLLKKPAKSIDDEQLSEYFKKQTLVEDIMNELESSAPIDDQLPVRKRRRH